MYCQSCGSLIPDGASYCADCGAAVASPVTEPVQPAYQQQPYQQPAVQASVASDTPAIKKRTNIAAIIGVLFSILSIILCAVSVALPMRLMGAGAPDAVADSTIWQILLYISLGCCPVGFVCSIVGLVKAKTHGLKPMAIVGIALPFLCAMLSAVILLLNALADAMGY